MSPKYPGVTDNGVNSRLTWSFQVSLLRAFSGCGPWTSLQPVLTLPVSVLIVLLGCSCSGTYIYPPDDIASSVWTMMEENVAITCACLPMMWTPLARLFPSFFSLDHGTDSYGSSGTTKSGPKVTSWPRGNWNLVHVQPDTKGSISMNQISNSQTRPSEDGTGQILPSSQGDEAQYQNATGITKVTEYHVSYSKRKSPSRRIGL